MIPHTWYVPGMGSTLHPGFGLKLLEIVSDKFYRTKRVKCPRMLPVHLVWRSVCRNEIQGPADGTFVLREYGQGDERGLENAVFAWID